MIYLLNFFNLFQANFFKKNQSQLDYYIYQSLNILILLLPIALITGPFLSDLIIVISSILIIFITIKEKKYILIFNPYSFLFFIFSFYLIIRSLFSIEIKLSLESSLFYIRFFFLILAVIILKKNNKSFFNSFLNIYLIGFTILLFFALIQLIFNFNIYTLSFDFQESRISSLFGSELIMGSYVSRIFPVMIGLLLYQNLYKTRKILFVNLIIFSFLLVFISGERTALFNIFFSSSLFFILINKSRILFTFSIVIALILMFLTINFSEKIKDRVIDQTLAQTNLLDLINSKKEISTIEKNTLYLTDQHILALTDQHTLALTDHLSASNITFKKRLNNILFYFEKNISFAIRNNFFIFSNAHMEIYRSSLKIFKDNVYYGVGPKLFRIYCKEDKYWIKGIHQGCTTHSHNLYLQLLSETGLFGFVPVILVFFYIFFALTRFFFTNTIFNREYGFYDTTSISFLIAIFVNLWPLIPSGNIFHNWMVIVYYIPVAFLFANIIDNKQNKSYKNNI